MAQEYAYDITLHAVARVRANSDTEARAKMAEILDACDPRTLSIDCQITEISLTDDHTTNLFQIKET